MKIYLLWSLFIAGVTLSASAQIGGFVNQVENSKNRERLNQIAQTQAGQTNAVPELYEGESSDLGPQSVVQEAPRRTFFEVNADAQFFHTDNLLMTDSTRTPNLSRINTTVLIGTIEAAFAPSPYPVANGTLAPRLGFQQQWFNFGIDGNPNISTTKVSVRDLDFNAQTVFTDGTWNRGPWSICAGLDVTRLLETSDYDQFYEELAPYWTARYTLSPCNKVALGFTYEGDYHLTHIQPTPFNGQNPQFIASNANDRTDQGLLVTCTGVICPQLVFQPYYRFKYTYFPEFPVQTRDDYLNEVGAGLYWLVCPNCTIRAFVDYDYLKSTLPIAEYHKLDAGGGISASLRF